MTAARKKSGAKAKAPPPIEGEILQQESVAPDPSRKGRPARDGVAIFRRFVWLVTAASVIFIAGLIAAPTLQEKFDTLLGRITPDATAIPPVVPPAVTQPDDFAALETAEFETLPVAAEPAPDGAPEGDAAEPRAAEAAPAEPALQPVVQPDPAALVARITALEDSTANAAVTSKRLEALAARLARLEGAVARKAGDGATGRRISDLEARLAEIEQRAPATAAASNAANDILLALARLSQRLDAGQAYGGEMLELRTLYDRLPDAARAGNEAHVAALAAEAESGVKDARALARDFAEALPVALAAAALPEDAGWWDKVWAGLKGVIVVRRTGEVEGSDAEAVLARMEFHLAREDIAAALDELQNLQPHVREALSSWQADARARLTAIDAAAALIAAYSANRGSAAPSRDE